MLREKSLRGKRLDGIGRAFLIKDFPKVTEKDHWGQCLFIIHLVSLATVMESKTLGSNSRKCWPPIDRRSPSLATVFPSILVVAFWMLVWALTGLWLVWAPPISIASALFLAKSLGPFLTETFPVCHDFPGFILFLSTYRDSVSNHQHNSHATVAPVAVACLGGQDYIYQDTELGKIVHDFPPSRLCITPGPVKTSPLISSLISPHTAAKVFSVFSSKDPVLN